MAADQNILMELNKRFPRHKDRIRALNFRSPKHHVFDPIQMCEERYMKVMQNIQIIVDEIIFPDHYNFSNKDINEIKSIAKEKRLEIVTSEKDYLRLDNSKKKNIKFIKVDLKISNQKKFESFLNKNL